MWQLQTCCTWKMLPENIIWCWYKSWVELNYLKKFARWNLPSRPTFNSLGDLESGDASYDSDSTASPGKHEDFVFILNSCFRKYTKAILALHSLQQNQWCYRPLCLLYCLRIARRGSHWDQRSSELRSHDLRCTYSESIFQNSKIVYLDYRWNYQIFESRNPKWSVYSNF